MREKERIQMYPETSFSSKEIIFYDDRMIVWCHVIAKKKMKKCTYLLRVVMI